MQNSGRQSLWRGTLTLTGAAMAARGLGLVYRILLARFLGAEGLGLYQMIFPVYISLITLAVAGTPIAVSQMVAEGRESVMSIFRSALKIVLAISIPLTFLLIGLAHLVASTVFHDPQVVPLLRLIAPALVAVAFSAVLRGFLLGNQTTEVPALSQISEQIFRVFVLWALMSWLGQQILVDRTWVAVALVPLGEVVSLAILAWGFLRWQRQHPLGKATSKPSGVTRSLLKLSAPITLSRLLTSLVGIFQAILIPRQLMAAGLSQGAAIAYFGKLTGMALPVIFFPTALTVALSTNLVPAVAEAAASTNRQALGRLIGSSMRATALWSAPISVILLLLGVQIEDNLFHTQIAPTVFLPLVGGAFFLYFDTTLTGILRGLGRTEIPMVNDLIGSAVEIALIVLFGGRPGIGPTAMALAIASGFITTWALNLVATVKVSGMPLPWATILVRPLLATVPVWVIVTSWEKWAHYHHYPPAPTLAIAVALATLAYVATLTLTGTRWQELV